MGVNARRRTGMVAGGMRKDQGQVRQPDIVRSIGRETFLSGVAEQSTMRSRWRLPLGQAAANHALDVSAVPWERAAR